eukprot:scaffold314232_cov18-Tisochrysis_lutea.AAC.1
MQEPAGWIAAPVLHLHTACDPGLWQAGSSYSIAHSRCVGQRACQELSQEAAWQAQSWRTAGWEVRGR